MQLTIFNLIAVNKLFLHKIFQKDRWTMWYLKQDQKKKWEEMQDIVHTFDMVEDFWSIYNHIKQPSELNQGDDYSMFKMNIRPMWEDAANKNGGRWLLTVDKQYRRSKLDDLWLDTVSFICHKTSIQFTV